MISLTETVVSFVTDYNTQLRNNRTKVVLLVCGAMLLAGLPMVTKNGVYIFDIVDKYSSAINLVILATIEAIFVSWIYGIVRFINDLKMMTDEPLANPKILKALEILWKFVIPVLNVILLINTVIGMDAPKRSFWSKDFLIEYSAILAVPLLATPIVILLVPAILKIKDEKSKAFGPTEDWGPAKDVERMAHNGKRTDGVVYNCIEDLERRNLKEASTHETGC